MKRLCRTVLLLTLPALAQAAEPAPPPEATPAPATASSKDASPSPAVPEASRSSASDEAAATRKANERFKPSEKISEDLSVSFPSDI